MAYSPQDSAELTLGASDAPSGTVDQTPEDDAPALGPLLDAEDGKKVKAAILKNWKDQDRGLSYQLAEVEQAEFWRSGERWVFIRPADDDMQHEIWRPSGIERLGKMPDRVDQLVRRLTAQLLVDPPSLEAEPQDGTDTYQKAAELATRIFQAESGVDGWDFRSLMEGAIDIASTSKSAFAHVMLDPVGGGEQPVTVLASPYATHYDAENPDACLMEPGPVIPAQVPGMAPMQGPPVRTASPVTRYLNQDGSLTEHETDQTVKRWVPWPTVRLMGFRNVRFMPEWCRGIEDADGLIVADYMPIGFLKELYPDTVGEMDDQELRKLVAWNPLPKHQLLPPHTRDPKKIGTRLADDVVPDDAIALVMWEYHRQSPVYPKGCMVCIAGADEPIAGGTLEVSVEQKDGRNVHRVLRPPVAQCRCINDWIGMRPHGTSLVSKLGPWAELMGQQWSAVMDWLDRWNHPHQFIPLGSSVQPGRMAIRTGEPIYTNPNGAPVTEAVPPIPRDVKEFLDRATTGMDKEALLSEEAQGLETPSITSGKQAQITVAQATVALSSIQQNATNFLTTLGNLLLERLQAYVTVPQAVEYVGDDGAYKADEWRSVELTGVKGVRLKRGTFTMMSPEAKKAALLGDVAHQILPLEDAVDQMVANTRTQFGMQDDPVRQRISRQIHACLTTATPFDPLPVDVLPPIAHARFRELARTVMGTAWLQSPQAKNPQVKQMLLAELERMRQAAGQFTLAEQGQHTQAQADKAAQHEITVKSTVEQAKAKAQSDKTSQQILHEHLSDIILLATKAGLDTPQLAEAIELMRGVLGLDAAAVGVIHAPPKPAPVPAVPPRPPSRLQLVPRTGNGIQPPHTPAQVVPQPAIPSPAR